MTKVFSNIGAFVGIALMIILNPAKGESQLTYMVVGAVFGAGGSLVGGIIGSLIEKATHEDVPAPEENPAPAAGQAPPKA